MLTRSRRVLPAVAVTALLLTACGSDDTTAADTTSTDAASDEVANGTTDTDTTDTDTGDADTGDTDTDEAGGGTADAVDAPGTGFTSGVVASLPDGSTLTLADFAGSPVFVETFATWCSNCRQQLATTNAAAQTAGEDAVFLALSVETDLDPAVLTDYAADNGFGEVTFAVLAPDALAVLVEEFGNAVLSPPSVPSFTVSADGTPAELVTGSESVDEILMRLGA